MHSLWLGQASARGSTSSAAPLKIMQTQHNTLSLDGMRTTGPDVRQQNVTAALAISNVVKSSLGPVGLDKMLVSARARRAKRCPMLSSLSRQLSTHTFPPSARAR